MLPTREQNFGAVKGGRTMFAPASGVKVDSLFTPIKKLPVWGAFLLRLRLCRCCIFQSIMKFVCEFEMEKDAERR
jgi:hypothetical protein